MLGFKKSNLYYKHTKLKVNQWRELTGITKGSDIGSGKEVKGIKKVLNWCNGEIYRIYKLKDNQNSALFNHKVTKF
mgnify:CR=1 FL=1